MERQPIWSTLESDYKDVKAKAPDGFEPVVEVFIHGRPDPVEIGRVEAHRDPDHPWVRFESRTEAYKLHPRDRWVYVTESNIGRIEVRLRQLELGQEQVRVGGFTYTETGPSADP